MPKGVECRLELCTEGTRRQGGGAEPGAGRYMVRESGGHLPAL